MFSEKNSGDFDALRLFGQVLLAGCGVIGKGRGGINGAQAGDRWFSPCASLFFGASPYRVGISRS